MSDRACVAILNGGKILMVRQTLTASGFGFSSVNLRIVAPIPPTEEDTVLSIHDLDEGWDSERIIISPHTLQLAQQVRRH